MAKPRVFSSFMLPNNFALEVLFAINLLEQAQNL